MNNKKLLFVSIAVLVIAASVAVVYAFSGNTASGISNEDIPNEIKAADVCEAHLIHDCPDCDGAGIMSSYATYCPYCNIRMTLCCSHQFARDDYYNSCYVASHPNGCNTVQDWCWNAYVCPECGYFTRGSHTDDMHVGAYWHTGDSSCRDDAYCSLPYYLDLISACSSVAEASEPDCTDSVVRDPLAAGDYCEIHGVFDCQIPHNDVVD